MVPVLSMFLTCSHPFPEALAPSVFFLRLSALFSEELDDDDEVDSSDDVEDEGESPCVDDSSEDEDEEGEEDDKVDRD